MVCLSINTKMKTEVKFNDKRSSSNSSVERYDPLADSDCSSANSDNPNLLTQEEM